ncbi:MAG TPA: DUF6064 family protein [Ignavibacteria bacterium]|nr:DUF6064 family protein [Ignavibacteria bacterium]
MNFPFGKEQFLDVFKIYNNSVFPAQIIFYLIAILVIFLTIKKNKYTDTVITIIFAFFWLWMGVVYHILFFSVINKAAYFFGIIFIIQSLLFIYFGLYKKSLSFRYRHSLLGYAGIILILYALVIYPAIGYLAGHVYPANPTFSLPCPTTIFTFGILLWTDKQFPLTLIIIPVIWSIIGFFAAVNLGVYEDIGLLAAGVIFVVLFFAEKKTDYPVNL